MNTASDGLDYLLFDLRPARFAIRVEAVREVLRAVAISPVPDAPGIVEGVIDLRGKLVPVLDMRARFGIPAKANAPGDHFVVARASTRQVCIRVDQAIGLATFAPDRIEAAEHLIPGAARILGLARDDGGIVLIHDLDTFLSSDEVAALAVLGDGA